MAEACLWKFVLRARKMKGYGFRRQRCVMNFIADFMCKELMLIIEVDGMTHWSKEAKTKDKKRDKVLSAVGFTTLRFGDDEVLSNIIDVQQKIETWIYEREKEIPVPLIS